MRAVLFVVFTAAGVLLILPYLGIDVWGRAAHLLNPAGQTSRSRDEPATRERIPERVRPADTGRIDSAESGVRAKDAPTLEEIESLLD